MAITGAPRVFEDKFSFIVEIDGIAHAGFQKCSALEFEIDKVEYREGGRKHAFKSPGLVNFSDITLERGAVADDSDLYDWAEQCASIVEEAGVIETDFRRNFDIVVKDRDGTPLKRWRCTSAWVQKFTGGEWDNDASEKTIEQVVLVFDKFERRAV
jgi:phage tail-like protein